MNEKLGREEKKEDQMKEGCQCPGVRGQLRSETPGSLKETGTQRGMTWHGGGGGLLGVSRR